jgi:hypothetical protein
MPSAVGYHGTTKSTAEDILSGKLPFAGSTNAGDWLGAGTYFWQDAPYRAAAWAKSRHPGKDVAVLEADIDLQRCLDLFDALAHKELFRAYTERFLLVAEKLGMDHSQDGLQVADGWVFTKNDPKPIVQRKDQYITFRDRAFIDWYVADQRLKNYKIGSVRGLFLVGRALYPESFLFNWSNAQITVLDPALILSVRSFALKDI